MLLRKEERRRRSYTIVPRKKPLQCDVGDLRGSVRRSTCSIGWGKQGGVMASGWDKSDYRWVRERKKRPRRRRMQRKKKRRQKGDDYVIRKVS